MTRNTLEIIPFETNMLSEAAYLLATRHKKDRKFSPLLPANYEERDAAFIALEAVWKKAGAMGVAAYRNRELLGFMIGNVMINSIRGRHAWIHPAGAGVSELEDLELYRDMYTVLGEIWVENGIFDHYVLLPSVDISQLNPWFRLGFSLEQTHGLMDLNSMNLKSFKRNHDLTIRRVNPEDRKIVESFSTVISRAHAASPVWGVSLPEDIQETREGYGELVEDEEFITWLAFLNNEPVGIQVYRILENSQQNMLVRDKTIVLVVGSTFEEVRGQGVSSTLLYTGLKHAKEQGYEYCETDWRTTHLLSSRHWPKVGFQPIANRLVRKVDSRITWANGFNELFLKKEE